MVKSIIKRIIIGVSVGIILYLLKGGLIANVYAENIAFVPNDIVVVTSGSNTAYSVTTNTWNNETVYAFPSTVPTDWSGNDGTIYFRYSQFNGANYCSGTSNNGSISGRIYNGNRNIAGQVRLEDRVNNSYYNCNTTLNGTMATFTCNNINLSHSLNLLITGANGGRYGISRLLDLNCTMTNEGLANAIGGSTNTIINNNNNNTNSIINNNNQNTQSIINNNNQNTQQTIESQKVCTIYDKTNLKTSKSLLNTNGEVASSDVFGISGYIRINSSTKIKVVKERLNNSAASTCFYNANKTLISCIADMNQTLNSFLTIPNDSSFVRFSINTTANAPQYEVCSNGNQSIVDSNNELNDSINDKEVSSDTNSLLDTLLSQQTQGPIADLILLPITLFGAYLSGFSSSCSTFNLGTLLGHNLSLPCIDLQQILGSSLYNLIDSLFALFMIYNIVLMCIDMYESITSLEDPFRSLYKPKHADYKPRHGGGN